MTRPVPWRRTTAAQRRAQREAYKALKEQTAENPSPETLAYQARNRAGNVRTKALAKVKGALAGEAIHPFSALQIAKVTLAELEQLRHEGEIRVYRLDSDARARLRSHWWMMLLSMSDDQLAAIASLGAKRDAAGN